MQSLITCVLVLSIISPCLCLSARTKSSLYNVIDYGAKGDGQSDDTKAFLSAWKNTCGAKEESTLVIPEKYTFLVTGLLLTGPCSASSIKIQLQGEIIAPDKDGWASFANTLIMISNVNSLKVDGSGGLINGYGSAWWKCKSCQRPSILNFSSCKSLNVINLNLINSPKSHIHIHGCSDATFTGLNISSPETSPNTDGFDISYSQNVLIENSIIATGDDCVAISGGSSHVNVTGISCGPGHGISIGSLGKKYDTVENVYVSNINFTRTTNGVRIKTIQNGVGYAKQITFQDITFEETRFPIIIDQHYTSYDDSLGNGRSVEVSGITYRDFKGTSADGRAIYLNCADSGCFDLTLDDINLVSNYPGKPATCFCNNAHGTVTSTTPNCSGLLTA